jgi:cytoplasmic iron level regulating protein YaaA (DUF328/UPF0246 family)
LPPKTKLDGIGPLAAWWRDPLRAAMPDEPDELVVDMRSVAYTTVWKPKRATLLAVRAFTETNGERKAASHMAKAVREKSRAPCCSPSTTRRTQRALLRLPRRLASWSSWAHPVST